MKLKFLIALLISTYSISAQQEQEKLWSFSFQEKTLQEVFMEIEQDTPYRFYYADSWLDPTLISKTYNNRTIAFILTDLFEKTTINFYIDSNKRIIITKNNSIYDTLPEDFLKYPKDSVVIPDNEVISAPIFLNEERNTGNTRIETIRIGRESKNTLQKRFTLSGRVTNSLTGLPLANAAIFIKKNNIGTTTNRNGYYELELPNGLNLVEISLLGFETLQKKVILYDNGTLNVKIDENYEELEEVLVESNATQNVESTDTGNTKIDSEESKNIPLVLGERNVLKIATTLPGVTTGGEGASGFNVRGGKTDQNLILLDDGVIYNPTHFFGVFQALNPFAIKEVNIYKGSIPVSYGGRLSSVFDIQTKDASKENLTAEVSVGPVTANAVVETPIKKGKSGILVGGRAAYSNWVLRSLRDAKLKNSQAGFYDFITKYDHIINTNNKLSATGYYSNDNFSITSDSLFSYTNRMASVKWSHRFSENSDASVLLTNSQYKFNIDFEGSTNANFLQRFQIDETEFKLVMRNTIKDTHRLTYGISSKLYSVLPGEINPKNSTDLIIPLSIEKEKGLESAIFVADNYEISEKLQLDVGLRYSFFAALGPSNVSIYDENVPRSASAVIGSETFNNNEVIETYGGPEARVSARYLLNDDFSVKASFGNTYQFIHTLSNNTTVSPIDTWKLSDTYIKPQQAQQISLGLYKNINLNAYEISLEGFYKKQQNVLDFKTGAKLLLNENIETEVLQGDGKAYGVEFLLRKNDGKLNGWFGYTYSRSFFKLDSEFRQERVNDGEFFPSNFDKPHDLSLVLNYKFSRRISMSSNFVYQTGRPITFPVGNYTFNGSDFVLYSDRNQFRVPDYYRLDIGFNFEGNHKKNKLAHSFWSISVYNILGRNNPYSVFFVTQDGQIKALQSSIFAVPVPSITYNIKF